MRKIKDCYKELKLYKDYTQDGDFLAYCLAISFFKENFQLSFLRSKSDLRFYKRKKEDNRLDRKAWTKKLYRRLKNEKN